MPKYLNSLQEFVVTDSPRLQCFIHLLHACAIPACWLNDLPCIYRGGLTIALICSWWRTAKRQRASGFHLRYRAGAWQYAEPGEAFQPASLLPSTTLTPFAVFLHIHCGGRKKYLPVLSDALEAGNFRRLIACLKFSIGRQANTL